MRLAVMVFLLATLSASAELPHETRLPVADSQGNYWSQAPYWEVVDPDPAGLNARQTSADPGDMGGTNFLARAVDRRFPRGTILRGGPVEHDHRGLPWVRVELRPEGERVHRLYFWVRSRASFLRPLHHPPPRVEPDGSYSHFREQRYWRTVREVEARMHPDFRFGQEATPVESWPVVERLPSGTILASHGIMGAYRTRDSHGRLWILVNRFGSPNYPMGYFVPAQTDSIEPTW